jgi:hypothetical protein
MILEQIKTSYISNDLFEISENLFQYLEKNNNNIRIKLWSRYDCYYGAPSSIVEELNNLHDKAVERKLIRLEGDFIVTYKSNMFICSTESGNNNFFCNVNKF